MGIGNHHLIDSPLILQALTNAQPGADSTAQFRVLVNAASGERQEESATFTLS